MRNMMKALVKSKPAVGLWMAQVWLRNLVLTFLLAHGLHMIFHEWALQGQDHKYDPRPYPRRGRMFTFDRQLADNMFSNAWMGKGAWRDNRVEPGGNFLNDFSC